MSYTCPIFVLARLLTGYNLSEIGGALCLGETCAWFGQGCPAFKNKATAYEALPKIEELRKALEESTK